MADGDVRPQQEQGELPFRDRAAPTSPWLKPAASETSRSPAALPALFLCSALCSPSCSVRCAAVVPSRPT